VDGQTYGRTDRRTYAPTDGHFRPPLMLLGRLGAVDLKIIKIPSCVNGTADQADHITHGSRLLNLI